jgi:hypothetical protein
MHSRALIFIWRTTLISLIDSCTFRINPSYIIHSRERVKMIMLSICCASHFISRFLLCILKIDTYMKLNFISLIIASTLSFAQESRSLEEAKWKQEKCFNSVNFHFIVVLQYFFTTSLFMISCCCCVLWRWIIFTTSSGLNSENIFFSE